MRFHSDPRPAGALRRAARVAALCLVVALAACVQTSPQAGPFPRFAEFSGKEIRAVEFAGEMVVPEDSLRGVLTTRASRCEILFLPVCIGSWGRQRETLDLDELARDVVRIQVFHRTFGYFGTRVVPDVVPVPDRDAVRVRFAVSPGDLVVTRRVEVEGTEGIVPPQELERRLPLRDGDPFGVDDFQAAANTVLGALLSRGYAYAQVLRNYSIDTIADVAEAQFGAVPGPLVRVDTILVLGTDRLNRRTVLKQLSFREGDVLVAAELNRSQRNLYDLGLVNFASVQLAPDSLQVDPDSARATVAVRVVEAPRYLAEASAGYGTLDCLRTQSRLVDRNFLGGARRLEVTGAVSKIGTGAPLDWGLDDRWLCSPLAEDPFSDTLNYRIAATFTQPRLFGTRTSTTLGVHTERVSEVERFLRVSRGAQLTLGRQVERQTLLTTTLNVERVRTNADDDIFCVLFQTCTRELIEPLRETRWSNSLGVGLVRDRTVYRVFPVGGYQFRANTDWASSLLASDDEYLRLLGDGAAYREIRPGWVLAGRLMAGTFVERFSAERAGFIPPERLFYAGGPNTVRGVGRNALGPAVYIYRGTVFPGDTAFEGFSDDNVDPAPTGGTRVTVGSVELRMPSPLLGERLRFAAFVDAGKVWTARDTLQATAPFVITPGVGVRYLSPVGPIRVDMAFNPYDPEPGPLFGFRDGELFRIPEQPVYTPERRSFWDRLQFYITVGQPF